MLPFRINALAVVFACLALWLPAAQPSAQPVEIADVNFRSVRAPRNPVDTWYEADVAVEVKVGADHPGRMLNRVHVALSIATETLLAAGTTRTFHRCEAETVALASGRHHIRFYLPPEIVKRDSLRGPPKEWLVEISVQGKALAITQRNYSSALRDPQQLADFRTKIATEAPSNDGIMRPQFLTPFDRAYPNDTPSFIRRSG